MPNSRIEFPGFEAPSERAFIKEDALNQLKQFDFVRVIESDMKITVVDSKLESHMKKLKIVQYLVDMQRLFGWTVNHV